VEVEVIPALPEQQPILANLLELYAHDFSEFQNLALGPDGRFGYKHLPTYWSEPNRHPFLVRMNDKLAGLILVKRGSEVSGNALVWDMAEFFVARGYRRRGLGTEMAHEVWKRFPGEWEVRVMQSNIPAYHFWERTISTFLGKDILPARIDKGGECWSLFTFQAQPAAR
jgi:predicted acetyltransferase